MGYNLFIQCYTAYTKHMLPLTVNIVYNITVIIRVRTFTKNRFSLYHKVFEQQRFCWWWEELPPFPQAMAADPTITFIHTWFKPLWSMAVVECVDGGCSGERIVYTYT